MKTILTIAIIFFTGLFNSTVNQSSDLRYYQKNNEDFFEFFESFSLNEEFQLSRIKFPIMFISWNESFTDLDTTYIKSNAWEFRQFYFTKGNDSYGQVYDNLEHQLKDTNERVFEWHGIGNGIRRYLYFERINGLWYLIKEEDLSS